MLDVWCDIATATQTPSTSLSGMLTHAPIQYVVADPAQLSDLTDLRLQGRVKLAGWAGTVEQVEAAAGAADIVVVRDEALLNAARQTNRATGLWYFIQDAEALQQCREAIDQVDFLLVSFRDETNIPLELLIAAAQGSHTQIVKHVMDHSDAVVTRGVLESGPSGVMFAVENLNEVVKLTEELIHAQQKQLPLVPATVTAVSHAGLGYRGCIDTTWLLEKDEGMLVGSTSRGGLLVCAEVHHLPYMNLRPFRVNAGAVHSYVWADGATEYITDLQAGRTVLAVNTAGLARPVTVGRVKTERRPLRLIEVLADGVKLNVFVQDDWHVRLFGADGQPRNCSTIQVGDQLLAYVCEAGRHVGIKVDETIEER
ncbi:MAG: 3-dehydroquinate synthase II [Chloroflexota bacterium]